VHRTGQNNRLLGSVESGKVETNSSSSQNENNGDGTASDNSSSIGRRKYLTLLGASAAVVALGGRPALAIEETGYGINEYGDGIYGDTDGADEGDVGEEEDKEETDEGTPNEGDDERVGEDEGDDVEEAPTAEPAITRFDLQDTSNFRNPHVDLRIDWGASIDEGELAHMEMWVEHSDGTVVGTFSEDLDGQTDGGTESLRIQRGAGDEYVVRLHVTSAHDTKAAALRTIET